MKRQMRSKTKALLTVYTIGSSILLALFFNNCSGSFESYQDDKTTNSLLSVAFDEDLLRRQLEEGISYLSLPPISTDPYTIAEATSDCVGALNPSALAAQYLGLSKSNTVYGTVVDLCSYIAPSVQISFISDGSSNSVVTDAELLPVDFLLVDGVFRTVYLFSYQIDDPDATGLFWATALSNAAANLSLEVISNSNPIYYQSTKKILANNFGIKPRLVSELTAFTAASETKLYKGAFCVLAVGSQLSYQWSRVGSAETVNSSSRCLTIDVLKPSDQGTYRVRIWNQFGEVFSSAELTVNETIPRIINVQPRAGSIQKIAGDDLYICVTVDAPDSSQLDFLWQFQDPNSLVWTDLSAPMINSSGFVTCLTESNLSISEHDGVRFFVSISNSGGETSTSFELSVKEAHIAPTIITDLPSDLAYPSDTKLESNFCFTVKGYPLNDYEIRKNSILQTGLRLKETSLGNNRSRMCLQLDSGNPAYVLANKTDSGDYLIIVKNDSTEQPGVVNQAETSGKLRVLNQLEILSGLPTNLVVSEGSSIGAKSGTGANFCVTATGSSLKYVWRKYTNSNSGPSILLAIYGPCLTISAASTDDTGYYRVSVSNDVSVTVYREGALTVTTGVSIPSSGQLPTTLARGRNGILADGDFCITAIGSDLSYQWQYRANTYQSWQNYSLSGSPAASPGCLTSSNLQSSYEGYYRVMVSNVDDSESSTSNSGFIDIIPPPVVSFYVGGGTTNNNNSPVTVDVLVGETTNFTSMPGNKHCLELSSSSEGTTQFHWQKSSQSYSVNPSAPGCLTFPAGAAAGDAGPYTVTAANEGGSVTQIFYVNIGLAPAVISTIGNADQGANLKIAIGETDSFYSLQNTPTCFQASGDAISYSWELNGVTYDMAVSAAISAGCLNFPTGATAAAHSGNYTVTATNSAGSITQSFTLEILPPPSVLELAETISVDLDIDGVTVPDINLSVADAVAGRSSTGLNFTWTYSRTTNTQNTSFSSTTGNMTIFSLALINDGVDYVTAAGLGIVSVEISNDVGRITKQFELQLSSPPTSP